MTQTLMIRRKFSTRVLTRYKAPSLLSSFYINIVSLVFVWTFPLPVLFFPSPGRYIAKKGYKAVYRTMLPSNYYSFHSWSFSDGGAGCDIRDEEKLKHMVHFKKMPACFNKKTALHRVWGCFALSLLNEAEIWPHACMSVICVTRLTLLQFPVAYQ